MSPNLVPRVEWDVPAAGWAAALDACPDATWFHSAAWLDVVAQVFRTRAERVRFDFGDGRWALLPLSIRPLARGLVPLAVAGETGAYGGLVAPAPLTAAEAAAAWAAVIARHGAARVVGNPFAAGAHLPATGAGWTATAQSTHVLALRPLEELRAGFARGCRARGNKARRQGLDVAARRDPAAVDAFYALYEDSVRRWGDKLTWARPKAFFAAMLAAGGDAVTIFTAERDGEPVSALLFAAQGGVAHYVAGATRHDQLEACPSNLLMEEAMATYYAEGRAWLDLGPSNGLEGVQRFKESFGAQAAPFEAAERASPASRAYFAVRGAMATWRGRAQRPAGAA